MSHSHRTADDPLPQSTAYAEALQFLYGRINYERMRGEKASRYPFGLQRMTDLLRDVGLERYLVGQQNLPPVPLVHIAGTKGKGSVAAMVAATLSASGHRTGLYTSPHIDTLQERFRVDGEPCLPEEVVALVDRLKSGPPRDVRDPSFFEMTTAMALMHFDTKDCQAIVMEVGLGGRLDSTNVCAPSVSVVTSIGLDHQQVLGDTLVQIATEKAGIIKPAVPVVSGVSDSAAAAVVHATANEKHCPLFQLGSEFKYRCEPATRWGSHLEYFGSTPPLTDHLATSVSLEGEHQARNAAIAISVIDLLRQQGLAVTHDAVKSGLSNLQCQGRIERFDLPNEVLGIVDAAHNRDSVEALCDCLRQRAEDRKIAVVFGTSTDKAAEPMLQLLSEVTDRLVLTRFHGNPRFQSTQTLGEMVPESFVDRTCVSEDPIEACRIGLHGVSPGGTLVICGSFFLVAETRPWMVAQTR